jgi:hypothetical protein
MSKRKRDNKYVKVPFLYMPIDGIIIFGSNERLTVIGGGVVGG